MKIQGEIAFVLAILFMVGMLGSGFAGYMLCKESYEPRIEQESRRWKEECNKSLEYEIRNIRSEAVSRGFGYWTVRSNGVVGFVWKDKSDASKEESK